MTTKIWMCHVCRHLNAVAVCRRCGAIPRITVTVTHGRVGPPHNPYSRTVYEATVPVPQDGKWHLRLVCCSLTGVSLTVNGILQSNHRRGQPDPEFTISEFERLVGRTLYDIDEEDEERHRNDPISHYI